MMRRVLLVLSVMFCVSTTVFGSAPKLVLFVTVDQLRGDMPLRFQDRFGEGGFRLLMERGAYYTNAHFRHSTTFTAVGHASLFTGGNGATHGMAGNDWYDAAGMRDVYCVGDDDYPILDQPNAEGGISPRHLTSSTIGDELLLAGDGHHRVFSVSIKDRGAVIPGGQYGKAFWYDSATGRFITSSYYYEKTPPWVNAWNDADHAGAYRDGSWTLMQPRETYTRRDADDRPFERSYKQLGRTFPHALTAEKPSDYYSTLRFTPMGDEVTVKFVEELIKREQIGQDDDVDLLAVSLSATDYIGHAFGPGSLEAEDNMLRLDRTLAHLFALVDEAVGLDRTLIVLSSDHGVDETPESRHQLTGVDRAVGDSFKQRRAQSGLLHRAEPRQVAVTCCSAGRHFPDAFMAQLNDALKAKFDVTQDLIVRFWNPSFYLDLDVIEERGLKVEEVERELAGAIVKLPGFAFAVTRTDLLRGHIPDEPIMRMVQRAFHPTRSGNVLVVQSAGWYLYPDATKYSAMHGSPYAYDTYVPVFFLGRGIESQWIDRRVAPEDIAPTIARYLGVNPPSGATGDVLGEVTVGSGR